MSDVSVLDILLHGERIGTLTRTAGDRTLFAFSETYIADPQRSTLSLSFKDEFGELVTDLTPRQTQIEPFFSNLLPEGALRTYLARRAGVKEMREFFLLWILGQDLPGAVTALPAEGQVWPDNAHDTLEESEAAARRRNNALRFSLAGVQLKFSAIKDAKRGLTIPAKGVGGAWIVKLPSSSYAMLPENEFSIMTLAAKVGMDVPRIELVDPREIENLPDGIGKIDGKAFVIERFDRLQEGGAVHMEDFTQVLDVYPDGKYDSTNYRSIARVIAAEAPADIPEFIRRLVFNALIGNNDMHMKNWSLMYPDRRHARLAPAYDFVSTVPYMASQEAALNFSRTRRFDEFDEAELAHLAARALLPRKQVLDVARETVALFHQHWAREKKNLLLSKKSIAAIEAHVKTIPLAR